MNRGSADSGERGAREVRASMRPRFMNRGSFDDRAGSAESAPRCFNEAPIHESGK